MSVMADKGDPIRITHYINPHMFWFKYEIENHLGNPDLFDLECKLNIHYRKEAANKYGNQQYKPKLDEVCIVFFIEISNFYLKILIIQFSARCCISSDT
jgi:hypothetical protein